MSSEPLQGNTIVVTGVTGQVARPSPPALARDNRVIGAARFTDARRAPSWRPRGSSASPSISSTGDVAALPADADYVLNFAVAKTNDWERDLAANSGGLAYLMEHHRDARAFLHCSSTAVYKPAGHTPLDEGAALGDNHGVWPFLQHVQHLQDRRRGDRALGCQALRPARRRSPACRSRTATTADGPPSTCT